MNLKLKIKRGESKNVIFTIADEFSQPVDLTNKSVYFTIARGLTKYVNLAGCTKLNQITNKGQASFNLTSTISRMLAKGVYKAEICVTDELGNSLFYPNSDIENADYITITVSESLATP